MAADAMILFLARIARDSRKAHDIKIARIAVAADVDPSTLYRFERGAWPTNAGQVIAAYAEELGIEPIEMWSEALARWRASTSAEGAGPPSPEGELGRALEAAPTIDQDPQRMLRNRAAGGR